MATVDTRSENSEPTPLDTAWSITGRLIAGIVVYGGLGWLLSLWLGHRGIFVGVGAVVGLVAATVLVYVRLSHGEPQGVRYRSVKKKPHSGASETAKGQTDMKADREVARG